MFTTQAIEYSMTRERRVLFRLAANFSVYGKVSQLTDEANKFSQQRILVIGGLKFVGRESRFLQRITPPEPAMGIPV